MMTPLCRLPLIVAITLLAQLGVGAEDMGDTYEGLIPQPLLGLVHAPEVHTELKLSEQQTADLEDVLRRIDARWFPARNLPVDKQRTLNAELESQVREWFASSSTRTQQQRLRQLEFYAQGSRLLLRSEIAERVGLQRAQQQKLAALARVNEQAKKEISHTQYGDPALQGLQVKLEQAARAERDGMQKIVQRDQWQKLTAMLGEPFDPTRLKRIYPFAPEFVAVEHWVNSTPLTLRELRGQVVLVHFYAFQCHNCHANFGIYRRWQEELTKKGVIVIGIQTPETNRERDPAAVVAAAREHDLKFPILVDLKSDNWQAWGNTMWPCVYVVDKRGYIRMWWSGELNWKGATGDKAIEAAVDELLTEK